MEKTHRTVNLPIEVYDRLREIADAEDRTIGAQIKVLLERSFPRPAKNQRLAKVSR